MPINRFNSEGKSYLLYNGEVKLDFKDSGHRYEINGREVVGVTTILKTVIAKEALVNWAVKMTADYMIENLRPNVAYTPEKLLELAENAKKQHRLNKERAGTLGTDIHKWIETYIKAKIENTTTPAVPDGEYKAPIEGFLSWVNNGHVTFEESEKLVYSKKYDYAGTLDFIATVNGVKMLGDIKTSNYIYPESYFLQLAGYKYALEEENPNAGIKGMLIVRVPKTKDSKLEIVMVNNYEENAKAFLYGVGLYKQIVKLKNYYTKKGSDTK